MQAALGLLLLAQDARTEFDADPSVLSRKHNIELTEWETARLQEILRSMDQHQSVDGTKE
jgi:hypothetical protein